MARIIYSVTGEGAGHSSRSKEIITHLKKKHKVLVLSYGRAYKILKKHFKTEKIFGLHFTFKNESVDYLRTYHNNVMKTPEAIKSFMKVLKIIKKFKPDIIFTDFEPSATNAAYLLKIPLVSVDNQHRITHTKITIPKKYKKEALITKTVIRSLIVKATYYLVTSFHNGKPLEKKVFVFPPILRKEVLKLKPKIKDYILVYLTTGHDDKLPNILKEISEKFIVYGFNKNKKDKNLIFKKSSSKGFLKDLKDSKAIIANSGFTLITETLYLKKPMLTIPIKNQFEQQINA